MMEKATENFLFKVSRRTVQERTKNISMPEKPNAKQQLINKKEEMHCAHIVPVS